MLGYILLVACGLAGQVEAAAGDDLQTEVRRLVRQLNARQLTQREAAEARLLQLGPKVLDLLPQMTARTPAEVRQRIGRIRQKLQRALAEAAARPSLITLRGEPMPLSQVFAALQQQSGNEIVDLREQFGHDPADPKLKVDFDKTPFWEALDSVLDRAGLSVYSYGEDRAINVVARQETQVSRNDAASYAGPFRFEPIRIVARRELHQTDGRSLRLTLSVSWEPRLKPISLKQKMAELTAIDENGKPLELDDSRAELEVPARDEASVELTLPFKLPPRGVKEIASLKGKLLAMLPGKIETFTFDNLTTAKNVEKRIAGVTVTLEGVRKNNEIWEVRMRVRFDKAGGALESHRGWIFSNEAYLEGPDGKPIPYDSLETTRQAEDEVGIAYLFVLDDPPSEHKFIYKTPGAIIATEFDYEIKGVRLP